MGGGGRGSLYGPLPLRKGLSSFRGRVREEGRKEEGGGEFATCVQSVKQLGKKWRKRRQDEG